MIILLRLNRERDEAPIGTEALGPVFPCLRVGIKLSTRNGRNDLKCPSAGGLRMVREDTWAPSEGATFAWMVADEAVGYTRAFLTMWRSSRRLVCRRRPESGLRVNDISRIHWSQHLLTTQSQRPN
ncbi:uncharacterized protein TNCV_4960661 [Trichonephila clavipes]|uniref:Uncharacterized protein n=1 Tax=Trichonephila clavipes TaxID=2585209 RepID=A0A8X6SK60_TRICX|nr:uncharacterized protein TNCV_4960661 [Trichonephila clavipes]